MSRTCVISRFFIALLLLLVVGCQAYQTHTDTLDKAEVVVNEAIETNQVNEPVPADVADALMPAITLDAQAVPAIEDSQRFDISVSNIPAEQFFLSLVDGTSYNMVIHPEVTGSISLNLKDVSIPNVMEAVRDVYGFEFVRTNYGFQVLPGRLQARIYQINYLNVSRVGSSSTFVSSGALTAASNGGSSSSSDSGDDSNSGGTVTGGGRNAIGTQINTTQPETTFWNELSVSIQAIVGGGEGRSVVINPQSGVVVVRALPSEQREVETFLRTTQMIVQRQVILEAKIIEVTLSEGFQTGINWSAIAGEITAANVGGGSVLNNAQGISRTGSSSGTVLPRGAPQLDGTLAQGFGGVFSLALQAANFAAFIELLETQGNVQVLSSPRVTAMNNQKALIKVGTDEFFVTDISTTTVTGTSTTSSPDVELTPFFSGIALDVTPQISSRSEVILHIHPSVSQVVDQQKTITVGGLTQQLPLALSTVRESDTMVRARSGQIVVIGGLMQDRIDDQDAKAPLLGDLPLIGDLFKHKRKSSAKSELVILLRPIVVDSDEKWAGALRDSTNNLMNLRQNLQQWEQKRSKGFGEINNQMR